MFTIVVNAARLRSAQGITCACKGTCAYVVPATSCVVVTVVAVDIATHVGVLFVVAICCSYDVSRCLVAGLWLWGCGVEGM